MAFFEMPRRTFGAAAPADEHGGPGSGGRGPGAPPPGANVAGSPASPGDASDATPADTPPVCSDAAISCQEALEVVYEYLDGELGDVPVEDVREHFDICERCFPHLEFERSFLSAVRRGCAGAAEKAPAGLKGRVAELLAEADSQG